MIVWHDARSFFGGTRVINNDNSIFIYPTLQYYFQRN